MSEVSTSTASNEFLLVLHINEPRLGDVTTVETHPRFSYLEHCLETVASIDPAELEERRIGELIGSNQSTINQTCTYALGDTLLPTGEYLPLAIKETWNTIRLHNELVDMDILATAVPELIPKLPYFIGGIAIKGAYGPWALITEDANWGSIIAPRAAYTSTESLRAITSAFSIYGRSDLFHEANLEEHLAFEVDGEERLLDFFPSIFSNEFRTGTASKGCYKEASRRMQVIEKGMIIEIDPESPLAQSLQPHP